MNTIAEKIKLLRLEKGLKQEELGTILNTSRNNITKYELNRTTPSIDMIVSISKYFGVTTDFLLSNDPISQQNDLLVLMNKYTELKPEERELVKRLVLLLSNKN